MTNVLRNSYILQRTILERVDRTFECKKIITFNPQTINPNLENLKQLSTFKNTYSYVLFF